MLRAMFGMGGTEILVILIVALLFLGPDKLPEAAKKISKGIRDIKKQSRVLQQTIEDDEHIGGAIRDLRSALRGEEPPPVRPKPPKQIEGPTPDAVPAIGAAAAAIVGGDAAATAAADAEAKAEADAATAGAAFATGDTASAAAAPPAEAVDTTGASFEGDPAHMAAALAGNGAHAGETAKLTLPPTAGEPDGAEPPDAAELAGLVKPAPNTIPRGSTPAGSSEPPEPKHG